MTYAPQERTYPRSRLLALDEPDAVDRRTGLLGTKVRAKLLDFEPFDPTTSPGMPDVDRLGEDIRRAQEYWNAQQAPAAGSGVWPYVVESVSDVGRAAWDTATLEVGDKLVAGVGSRTGYGGVKGDYEGNLARERAEDAAARARSPTSSRIGDEIGEIVGDPRNWLGAYGAHRVAGRVIAPRVIRWFGK